MKKILFGILAMLTLAILAVPVMADQSQIQTRTGVVIVVDGRYFLDTDGDGDADIYLDFGPPWYEPVPRPNDGDTVTVTGKLTGEGTLDAEMDVYSLGSDWWRNPGRPPWYTHIQRANKPRPLFFFLKNKQNFVTINSKSE